MRRRSGAAALLRIPHRVSTASRFTGIRDTFTRSSAPTGDRNRSSSDRRTRQVNTRPRKAGLKKGFR
jgi:hypothetical protein